jgi:N-acetylglucosaminyldiphosphoundecaprenol N-acetyl-beta-D-mannosaminyltransferase
MRLYSRYGGSSVDDAEAAPEPSLMAGGATAGTVADRPRPPWRTASRARRTSTGHLPTVVLHGVRLHAVTEQQCISHILDQVELGVGGVVVTPNLDHLRRYTRDLTFGALVAEADLVVADGMPLVWASRLQGTPLPQRVAGSDLISSLSKAAAERGRSIFLLGGAPGTAEGAERVLRAAIPTLRVVGTHCPPMGFEKDPVALNEVVVSLVAAQPDIVFVALGSPKQEYLVERVRDLLGHTWWLGVGASFSFLSGQVKRAPRWMQRTGLEWIHRLWQEPRRLFRRYVVVGIPFGLALMWRSTLARFARKPAIRPTAAAASTDVTGMQAGNGNGRPASLDGVGRADAGSAAVEPPMADQAKRVLLVPRLSPGVAEATEDPVDIAVSPEPTPVDSSATPVVVPPRTLKRLRAMILLGGNVRQSTLMAATGRSVLDLPMGNAGTILNHWLEHGAALAADLGLESLPVRVLVNRNSLSPEEIAPRHYGTCRVERDLSEYRGTGGVLRDLAQEYADDDLILVANAAQVLLDPLVAIATALERKHGDVALVSHADGTPSGVMLVTCRTLRLIQPAGYVDMKEQALPAIAARHNVRVVHRRRPTALPVRSLAGYIQALAEHHRLADGRARYARVDPHGEDFAPVFSVVEAGAQVDSRAHVHDAVVLRGGIVEAGAVVVRSIVCAGGVVKRDRSVVDQLVCPAA